MPESLAWIERELESIRAAGLERPTRVRSGRQGATVGLDGHTFLNFGSNDYLGYAGDVRLAKAASKAACAQGFGAGASPLVSGHCEAHDVLEKTIAQWLDVEASLLFTSGFAANTATIAALAGPEDSIASDARNHASIIDGCRLSRAEIVVYPHGDAAALAVGLARRGAQMGVHGLQGQCLEFMYRTVSLGMHAPLNLFSIPQKLSRNDWRESWTKAIGLSSSKKIRLNYTYAWNDMH